MEQESSSTTSTIVYKEIGSECPNRQMSFLHATFTRRQSRRRRASQCIQAELFDAVTPTSGEYFWSFPIALDEQKYKACQGAEPMPYPVMLVHGLSANHHVFDLRQEESLAHSLCKQGYDVWMIDLRGSGYSEKAGRAKKALNWDLKAYAEDTKVAVDFALAHHGIDQLHIVGHSMGGIIGMLLVAAYPQYGPKIRSITGLASSVHYQNSAWTKLSPMLPLTNVLDFLDLQTLMRLYAPFLLWPSFVAHMTNVVRRDLQRVLTRAEKVPCKVLKDLATAFEPQGLVLDFGDGPKAVAELLNDVKHPVLLLAADMDEQCVVADIQRTLQDIGSHHKRLVVVGPKPMYQHHYGHVDIIIGKNTATEVFPHITSWLHSLDTTDDSNPDMPTFAHAPFMLCVNPSKLDMTDDSSRHIPTFPEQFMSCEGPATPPRRLCLNMSIAGSDKGNDSGRPSPTQSDDSDQDAANDREVEYQRVMSLVVASPAMYSSLVTSPSDPPKDWMEMSRTAKMDEVQSPSVVLVTGAGVTVVVEADSQTTASGTTSVPL